ncbi:MAG: hypothetical protein IKG70_05185 [Lachnospiraceae bacterium]|nr:hypothetical protein [Parasporobacterium sp.]MBR3397227.1 hypothetical protein [Lachnospiraceae bacterium]
MESNRQSIIYCSFCGEANDADDIYCRACGKPLYAQESQLKNYLRKELKDQLKDKITESAFNKLRKFLLAHLYGILLTASAVFTAASAVSAFTASDIPKDTVLLSEAPAADALGYLVTEEAKDSEPEAEDSSLSEEAAVSALSEEAAAFESQPDEIASAHSEWFPGPAEADNSFPDDILSAYRELLASDQVKASGYYVYDIDKDGIPEVLLAVEETEGSMVVSVGLEVWSFEKGSVYSAGVLWGFARGLPTPASYPDGNGIVLTEVARDYECVWVIQKDGHTMTDNYQNEANSVYSQTLNGQPGIYYTNVDDDPFRSVGHPYRAETAAPFYEGSQLLGFNSISDDSALKEALGL